ncbi:hypothetical protein [Streptomyces sp. NPDC093260]|uniref:hypothetical protein n=1 Tax=Streptomyces sp. NPDC093260 TaxID=3155073 RepID=UPI003431CF3A
MIGSPQRLGHPAPADVGAAARVVGRGAMSVADRATADGGKRVATLIQLEREFPEDTARRGKA